MTALGGCSLALVSKLPTASDPSYRFEICTSRNPGFHGERVSSNCRWIPPNATQEASYGHTLRSIKRFIYSSKYATTLRALAHPSRFSVGMLDRHVSV